MRRFKQLARVVRAGLRARYPHLYERLRPIAVPILNRSFRALRLGFAPVLWLINLPATLRNQLRTQLRDYIVGPQIAHRSDAGFSRSAVGAIRLGMSDAAIRALDWYYRRAYRRVAAACRSPVLSTDEIRPWSVVSFIGSLGPGGAERQLVFTLRGLTEHGFSNLKVVTLFLDTPLENFFRSQIDESVVQVAKLSRQLSASESGDESEHDRRFEQLYRQHKNLLPDELREIWCYVRELINSRPAVFHGWLDDCSVKGGIAAAIVGVPRIVLSTRSVAPDHFLLFQPYMREAYRMLAGMNNVCILNNSQAGARDYERWLGLSEGTIRVIPNGFDFAAIANAAAQQARAEYRSKLHIPPRVNLVGTVIRFSEEKRPLLWAETAVRIAQQQPDTWFLMIGDGPDRPAVERYVKKSGLSDRFVMPGRETNVPLAMAAMDVLLLTSRMEGLPNVLIEAQAVGTPVVSVTVGGAAETMLAGETGLLAATSDAAELANLVCQALSNEPWRRRASVLAKAHVTQEFNQTRMARRTIDAYFRDSFAELFPALVAKFGGGLVPSAQFDRGTLLCAIGTLGPGGSERQLVNLLNGMPPSKFARRILLGQHLSSSPHDFYAKHLERSNVQLVELPRPANAWRELAGSNYDVPNLQRVAKELEALLPTGLSEIGTCLGLLLAHRPYVVHAWLDEINIKMGLAAVIAGVPRVILSTRNLHPENLPLWQPYMRSAYRALLNQPNVKMLNNSAAGARSYEQWLELEKGSVEVVVNGFDFTRMTNDSEEASSSFKAEHNIPDGAPVIGSIMRLAPEKRPLLWLDVVKLLARRIPQAHFILVGDGPLRGVISESLRNDGIADRVRIMGLTRDILAPLSAMDVFLLTSEVEGLPNVLIEAQAAGVPVVASNAGGCAETFVPGVSGVLITEPTPEKFGEAVCELLETPYRLESAGKEGARFVRHKFAIATTTQRTLAYYDHNRASQRAIDGQAHALHGT